MIKLTDKVEKVLLEDLQSQLGHYSEYGAVFGDKEFVLVYKDNEKYLAHSSEFESKGFFVRLKEGLEEPKGNGETSTEQPSARGKPDVIELGQEDKKMKKKVCCKDCKYYSCVKILFDLAEECNTSRNKEIRYTYAMTYIRLKKHPKELNKNNNCKCYRRKWYKFGK